jgi:hypothetical protein
MDFRVYAEEYLSPASVIDAGKNVKLEIFRLPLLISPRF